MSYAGASVPSGEGSYNRSSSAVILKSTLIAALGGLLFGLDTAVISGTTGALRLAFRLSPLELGFTVSSALWGTIVGAWAAGYAGRTCGRRDSLRIMAALYLASSVGCSFAVNWPALLCARMIGGLGIGGSSVLGPMYIAEISPARIRGRMVGFFQLNVVAGILLAYLSNYLVSLGHIGAAQWRWQLAAPSAPAGAFLALLFVIPRSPRWLVQVGRYQEAHHVLILTGERNADDEVEYIAESISKDRKASGEKLFSSAHVAPIALAMSLAAFSQLSGINVVLYYLNDIFAAAGNGGTEQGVGTIAVGVTNLVFTALAMSVIDKVGRRLLLLIGSVGMAATLSGIGVSFLMHSRGDLLVWLLILYCASFSFSLGVVIWVYISEIFPTAIRAKGQSLGSLTHWAMNALLSALFPMAAVESLAYPFLFFSLMMIVQFFVVLVFFPETRSASLEDIDLRI